jgi:hypothetical protein
MFCQDEKIRDWLAAMVPGMAAWEGAKIKVVGMKVLLTNKRFMA